MTRIVLAVASAATLLGGCHSAPARSSSQPAPRAPVKEPAFAHDLGQLQLQHAIEVLKRRLHHGPVRLTYPSKP